MWDWVGVWDVVEWGQVWIDGVGLDWVGPDD